MQCFRSPKDPSLVTFVISPDGLQSDMLKLESIGIGKILLQCFPDTLSKSPSSWPVLLTVNKMYTVVVCKLEHCPICPTKQKCMAMWSNLKHEDLVIMGSVQVIQDSAYIWNVCKNKGCTQQCPYASQYVFDAAIHLIESKLSTVKRLSLNVDKRSYAFDAALKSYTSFGFRPSSLVPVGVPGILAFLGAGSRFQRMDFDILRK